jgi:hypothetical protein
MHRGVIQFAIHLKSYPIITRVVVDDPMGTCRVDWNDLVATQRRSLSPPIWTTFGDKMKRRFGRNLVTE